MQRARMRALLQAILHKVLHDELHPLLVHWLLIGCALALAAAAAAWMYAATARESRMRRAAEARLRALVESLPGAVFQCRVWPDGRMQYELLSASTRTVRGVDPEAARADPKVMLDSILEVDRKLFHKALAWGTRSMKPLDIDYRIVHPESGVRWIRSISSPLPEQGSVLWSGHWADITTQKELEAGLMNAMEAADAANRAKSNFLATMSHEIRTPMNGVLAMLELLSLSKLDADQGASLGIVQESGRSLLRIIDDILDFSKIEAGKMEIVPERASIARVVEGVANVYSGSASGKGLVLKVSIDPHIAPLHVFDPTRVRQILNNLVNNAIKFTFEGEVSISAGLAGRRGQEDMVKLQVSDTGIGMTPEQRQRVFEAFEQASSDTASRFGGTGLGLSICRHLARLMGGTIEMRTQPNVGTEVQVVLPMKPVPCAAAAEETRAPAVRPVLRREPPTIDRAEMDRTLMLLVDDHPVNRLVLLKQVNALGFAAETAESAPEALEKWKSGRFSVVFTDCNMPGMSGYDLARAIREAEAHDRGARTVLIACTANAMAGEGERCLEAGMDDYLVKPVELAQLASKLRRWMPSTPVDTATLHEISSGDERLTGDVLARFRLHNAGDAKSLRQAFRHRAANGVVAACHRIKGAGKTIGATDLAAVCEDIERAAREGDWPAVEGGMRVFDRELDRLDAYIETRIDTQRARGRA